MMKSILRQCQNICRGEGGEARRGGPLWSPAYPSTTDRRGVLQSKGRDEEKGGGKLRPYEPRTTGATRDNKLVGAELASALPHHHALLSPRTLLLLLALLAVTLLLPTPASADGGAPNLAYVAGTPRGISAIDIQQQKVTTTLSVPGDPHAILLSLDGRFLYVTQPALNRFSIIAARTGQTICSASAPGQPTLLTFDPGTNVVYVAGNGAASVSGFDATTCALKHTIQTSGPVFGLAVAIVGTGNNGGTGNQLWVADSTSIAYYDSSGKKMGGFPVAGGAGYLVIPTGPFVYATTHNGSIIAIDLNTLKPSAPLMTGGPYGTMDYDAATGEILVPDQGHNQIDVLAPLVSGSPIPHEPERVIPLGVKPESIAITSDGQLGFVALSGGNVAMLDLPGRQLVNTILVGGNPHFIITGLYPPIIGTTPQQASTWNTFASVLAYAIIVLLILVPIMLFRHFNQKKGT